MTFSRISLALATAGLMTVTACADLRDPNNPNRNAQQGALLGAGLGALIGMSGGENADDRRSRAIAGAVIGGGLGAVGGAALDRQEAELREQMGGQVGIVNTGSELIVTMPQDILFAVDSADLTGALRSDLRTLANSLNRYPDTTVSIIGHTDNTGSAEYNQDLSARRARAVSSVLVDAGVNPVRLRSIGRGEDAPIATNLTPEGRQLNRRVEIIITPNT
jgi:outer membrane protein OmpA-like peptidoglycan-associated protein